ncbi:MAG: metallophosphoesterase [Ruminococcaceae bacterium]|nr:metallophosphoesterase [Oscillospiraceae bacterium]
MRKKKKGKLVNRLVLLALLVVFVRMGLKNDLVVREYTVYSDKVTEKHTFAVIADLHSTEYGENQSELVGTVGSFCPDAVLFAGDMAEEERSMIPTETVIRSLAELFPCYIAKGNHDQWEDEKGKDMNEYFAALGAVPLAESYADVTFGEDTFRIHGIDDPVFYEYGTDFEALLSSLDRSEENFDILIFHRPEFAEYCAETLGFELTVSGHAHGGQVRIPYLLNGIYAPAQGWFPEYAGGHYSFEGGDVIVSRGMMIDEKPRFFNPPELVIVHVLPESMRTE